MKIIRHSRKMFACSLLFIQHFQPLLTTPPQKDENTLGLMLRDHGNVDQLIDTMQIALTSIDPIRMRTALTKTTDNSNNTFHDEKTIAEIMLDLAKKQTEHMTYRAQFLYNSAQSSQNTANKKAIRSSFVDIVSRAQSFYGEFTPSHLAIANIPPTPQAIDPLAVITAMKVGINAIHNRKALILGQTLDAINADLGQKQLFFEGLDDTCCKSSEQKTTALENRIFLRTRMVAYIFGAKQLLYEQQKTLDPNQPPAYNAALYPASQFADPFSQGANGAGVEDNNKN